MEFGPSAFVAIFFFTIGAIGSVEANEVRWPRSFQNCSSKKKT